MPAPDPAALAAALATVRKRDNGHLRPFKQMFPAEHFDDATELLARWFATHAGELWRVRPLDRGDLWSFLRDVLSQGTAIQMDYAAGKYGGYEAFSARMDASARERADEFSARLAAALEPAIPEATK